MSTLYDTLKLMFEQIRDEKRTAANTAFRIGSAFLSLLDLLKNISENIGENFLHSNEDDVAYGLIKFLEGAEFGVFEEGVSGAFISKFGDAEFRRLVARVRATVHYLVVGDFESGVTDSGARVDEKGNAEFEELVTRALATLAELKVIGDSVFGGNLSSEDFISGFLGGKGWSIKKNEYVNAAGETEYKYSLEVDNVTARGIVRVYEMVASQMRGENDNVTFSARMKVHHYDSVTGKVWLDTEGEQLMCVFDIDDCIMVQRFQPGNDVVSDGDGYITKGYELVIDEWGTGGAANEAGERLDWIRFRNFTTQMENGTAENLIARGDTFTRVDNLSNPERKGIIQIMTVGENRPHIDIIHSLKTDPDNALKGRLGNLEGIRHHLFGWLKGFGEYLVNAYVVGDVRLRRTGESLDTLVEILNGQLASKMTETVYELTEEDNFIRNAGFTELNVDGSLKYWTVSSDDIGFYTVDGNPVVYSAGTPVDVRSAVKTVELDGKMVLHLVNGSVTQDRNVMKEPGTHKEYDEGSGESSTNTYRTVLDTLFLSLRLQVVKSGTLTIGFPSSTEAGASALKAKTVQLERSSEWVTCQWSGTWDGLSDFFLGFTGEAYVSMLSLTTEPLSTFKTEYSTQIQQTARNISLIASRTGTNETSIAELRIEADRISSTVTENYTDLDGRIRTNASSITQTASEIRLEVQSVSDDLSGVTGRVATLEIHATDITARVSSTETTISSHSDDLEGLHGDITTITTRIGELSVTDRSITARVTSVETTIVQHTTDISGLDSDVSGLESDILIVTTRIGELAVTDSNITARVSTVETRSTNNATDITSLTTRIGELAVTDSNITARVSTVETRSTNNATSITGLGSRMTAAEGDIDTAESNITTLTTRIGELAVTDSSITARVSTVETRSTNNATSITGLGSRMTAAEGDIDTAESNISNLSTSVSGLTSRVSSLELSDTSITSRVSAVEGRLMQICDVDGWEQGTTGEQAGLTYAAIKRSSTTRIRTKNLYPVTAATACMLSDYGRTNMKVGFVYFTKGKVVCSTMWSEWKTQSQPGGKIDVGAPSNCAYVAVLMAFNNSGTITEDDVISSGITITSDKVVSMSEISQFIKDEDGVTLSHIHLKADCIDFDYGVNWTVTHNGVTVFHLDSNGNLQVKGTIYSDKLYQVVTQVALSVGGTSYIPNGCGDLVVIRLAATASGASGTVYLPAASSFNKRVLMLFPGILVQTQAAGNIYVKCLESNFFDYSVGGDVTQKTLNYGNASWFYSDGSKWYLLGK